MTQYRIREDLRPGAPVGEKIKRLIRENLDMSYNVISQQFALWDELEGNYRAYRPKDDVDRESIEKHGVQKIIIPIQFATVQTALTFLMEIYTALTPVLRCTSADPYSITKAQIMELCLDYDYRGNRGYLMMQQWFLNALRYGYGVMHNSWGTREIIKKQLKAQNKASFELEGNSYRVPGGYEYVNSPFTVFEGNTWKLIDNRLFLPDPRVPLARFQEGMFCGHRNTIHDNDLADLEEQDIFFNTKYIESSSYRGFHSDTDIISGGTDHNRDRWRGSEGLTQALTAAKKDRMHVNEELVIKIIPKDFKLSDEDRPQPWLFNLVNGDVITRCEASPYNGYPYGVTESYPDMLAFISQGLMEMTSPLARHIDFLFNSHMANVRKVIKDTLLVDPKRIDIRDVLDMKDGGLIRLLPGAYNTDPANAIKQLMVQDVTSGHFDAVQKIVELWEKFTGISAHMFGQISSGRRTAFELQGVFRQAGARMKMQADLMSCEGVAPLTEQMALLRQENMSVEQFIKLAGQTAQDLGVHPEDVINGYLRIRKSQVQDGVFHYPAEEGVLPADRAGMDELLGEVFETVVRNPFMMQVFDPVAIFKERVRQKGLRHIDNFMNQGLKAQTMILPPDVLVEMLEKKQIQTLGAGGMSAGRPDQGVREEASTLGIEGALGGAGASYNGNGNG